MALVDGGGAAVPQSSWVGNCSANPCDTAANFVENYRARVELLVMATTRIGRRCRPARPARGPALGGRWRGAQTASGRLC